MIFFAIALRIFFFAVSVERVPVSSDEALATLTAKRILRGHFPLLVLANQYQFPVDAYALVPFVKLLPRNAFGARLFPFLMGLCTTAAYLLLLARMAPLRKSWPAALLILLPSAYLMIHFCAYAIPAHSTFMLLSALALLCVAIQRDARAHSRLWAVAAGFFAALATSNHLLAAPVLATTGAFVCLGKNRKDAMRHAPAFLAGALLGLAPYLLARILIPGAYASVTRIATFKAALQRLWNPTLTTTLPRAFGVEPCVFPDGHNTLGLTPSLQMPFGVCWIVLMAALTLWRIRAFVLRLRTDRWPSLTLNDVFLGIAWLSLGLFIFNTLSFSHCYRYLLPVLWCFPFMIGYVFAKTRGLLRLTVGAAAALLVLFNAITTAALTCAWYDEDFAACEANIVDIQPALEGLERLGISHCYASYWAAYRINFETDEQVVCSQPINERSPGWYTPYKDQVDATTNVAYVLTDGIKYLKPKIFDRHLRTMNTTAETLDCGAFTIYYDFTNTKPFDDPLQISAIDCSHNPEAGYALIDGHPLARWSSEADQEAGMWVQASLPRPAKITGIRFSFQDSNFNADQAAVLEILFRTKDTWQPAGPRIRKFLDKFQMINGHPVYGHSLQSVHLDPIQSDALRIRIVEPGADAPWQIGELEVMGKPLQPRGDGVVE